MSSAALKRLARAEPRPDALGYLGPGVVVGFASNGVLVERDDGAEVLAEMALPLPYESCEGDVLLLVGRDSRHYVIGVLSGRGRTSLELEGNISLRAVGGVAEIAGDEGVRLRGPTVDVETGALNVVARTLVESVSTLVQRVTALLSIQAREMHTLVEESATTQAKSATIQTEEVVTINGKQVHLG
jgi:hypothetical protein